MSIVGEKRLHAAFFLYHEGMMIGENWKKILTYLGSVAATAAASAVLASLQTMLASHGGVCPVGADPQSAAVFGAAGGSVAFRSHLRFTA